MKANRWRTVLLAGVIAGAASLAFLTPMTLHLRLPDAIGPVAWHFCPETGLMAPRYYSPSAGSGGPASWEACLDENGQRIEQLDRHLRIVWSINLFWFALTFPLLALALSRLPPGRARNGMG